MKTRDRKRKEYLIRVYGIAQSKYDEIFKKQNGVCVICGKSETQMVGETVSMLSVDHDHLTNEIRGLLCRKCNLGIGSFEDDMSILQNAIQYLQKGTQK